MIVLCSVNDKAHHVGKCYCTTVGLMDKKYERIECLVPYWNGYGFSKGWGIVKGHQTGKVSDEEYTKVYKYILGNKQNWPKVKAWLKSLRADEDITLLCFCREGKFCHRQLIAEMIRKWRPDLEVVVH